MNELDRLRYENRSLKERVETMDIALGGFQETCENTIAILRELSDRFEDDPGSLESINNCLRRWSELATETIDRMRAFAPLPNDPAAN